MAGSQAAAEGQLAVGGRHQPGVMARGDCSAPMLSAYSSSLPNFSQVLQTMHGIGRSPGGVFGHEILDDPAEFLPGNSAT